jgi:hypothetical protein
MFRPAEYGAQCDFPDEETRRRAALSAPNATLQKRCAHAFALRRQRDVDWALGVLAWHTRANDLVLLPAHQMLNELVALLKTTLQDVARREGAALTERRPEEDPLVATYVHPGKKAEPAGPGHSVEQPEGTTSNGVLDSSGSVLRDRPLVNPDALYWGVRPDGHSLWIARQLSLILRSLSFVEENQDQLAELPDVLVVLLEMLASEDHELSTNALHAVANLADALKLSAEEPARDLVALLFGFLSADEESHQPVLESFVKLAVNEQNRKWVLLADSSLFARLDALLFSQNAYVQDLSASLLALFASFGTPSIKTAIADTSAAHLITLLSAVCTDMTQGSVTRDQLSFAEHSMTAVYHLASEPRNGRAFGPYLDVFLQLSAAVDDSPVRKHMQGVRNILYNIIVELGGTDV